MSGCSEWHRKLNEQGIGKCSVPMWLNGLPAGFCDKEAYGERPNCQMYRDNENKLCRTDNRYDGYVPFLACPEHGGPTIRVFKDGDMFCAVRPEFINLQESLAGFGKTKKEAEKSLLDSEKLKTQAG